MPEVPTSCISHVSLGTNNFDRAVAFYDKVMATLGCRRTLEHPGAVAYGHAFPEFWVQVPHDGGRAAAANGVHVGFLATSRAQVDAFHAAALAAGGTCDGPPGVRPLYGPQYYGAFVRDLDGHKIEAMFWDDSIQA
jgi:catechol 2,3-dioxygenase-like lactoylglutathione lyase family enzyme